MKIKMPEPNTNLDPSGIPVKILFCTFNNIRSEKKGYGSGRTRRLQAEDRYEQAPYK